MNAIIFGKLINILIIFGFGNGSIYFIIDPGTYL